MYRGCLRSLRRSLVETVFNKRASDIYLSPFPTDSANGSQIFPKYLYSVAVLVSSYIRRNMGPTSLFVIDLGSHP